jgi:hypothetical protein
MSAPALAGPALARRTAVFWGGTLAFGLSSVAVLAVLSHRLGEGGLAGPTTVLALSLVLAVLPGAVQLRVAAAAAARSGLSPVPWLAVGGLTLALLALAPALAYPLAVPAEAFALVALQLPAAVVLATRRGLLIGSGRLSAAGASLALEALGRLLAGVWLGVELGTTGLALAVGVATLLALAGTPGGGRPAALRGASVTTLGHTLLAVGMIVLLTNVDLLLAQRTLGSAGADSYDVAAVPAKAVFLMLFAATWLAVGAAHTGRLGPFGPPLATVSLGVLLTGALLGLRPLIAAVLGRGEPDALLLAVLGLAMALAGAASVACSMAVARGRARPWPPAAAAVGVIALVSLLHPSPLGFAAAVLVANAGALLAGLRLLRVS